MKVEDHYWKTDEKQMVIVEFIILTEGYLESDLLVNNNVCIKFIQFYG